MHSKNPMVARDAKFWSKASENCVECAFSALCWHVMSGGKNANSISNNAKLLVFTPLDFLLLFPQSICVLASFFADHMYNIVTSTNCYKAILRHCYNYCNHTSCKRLATTFFKFYMVSHWVIFCWKSAKLFYLTKADCHGGTAWHLEANRLDTWCKSERCGEKKCFQKLQKVAMLSFNRKYRSS